MSSQCIVRKAVYTVKKCSWGWASLSPETHRADLKRSLNRICYILLVAYIIDLLTHGLTNIKTSVQYYMWCMRKTAWQNMRNGCGCASLTEIVYCSLQLHLPSNANIFTILYEVWAGVLWGLITSGMLHHVSWWIFNDVMHECRPSTFRAKLFKMNRLLAPEGTMLCCNTGINLLFKTSTLQPI